MPKLRLNGTNVRYGRWSKLLVWPSVDAAVMSRSDSVSADVCWYLLWMFSRAPWRMVSRSSSPCGVLLPPSVAPLSASSTVVARKRRRSTKFTTFWSAV